MNRCRMQFGSRCLSPVAGSTTGQREKKKKCTHTLILASSKWGAGGTHTSGSAFVETQERAVAGKQQGHAVQPWHGWASWWCPQCQQPGELCWAPAEPQGWRLGPLGRALAGATARQCGDTQHLPVVPQLPQKEPTATLGNKSEWAGGTSHEKRLSASVNRFFSPQNHSWQRLSFLPGLPQSAAN